jgi:hypothetical protein
MSLQRKGREMEQQLLMLPPEQLQPAEEMYHLGREIERCSGMKMGTFAPEHCKF